MKKALIALAVLALAAATAATAAPATFQVDPNHSNAGFSIRHFFTMVPGRFTDFAGSIVYDAENPAGSSIEMTIQTNSIDTGNEDRDGHLRSPEFFDVSTYPTMTFKSNGVAGSGDTLQVTGDLTIHGVSKQVTIPVEVLGVGQTPMGTRAGFSSTFTIDRRDFGISWNRVLDTGGPILGYEVKITIDVEAVQQ